MEAQLTSLFARLLRDVQAIDDPRAANARHLLTDMLILAFLAVLAGMDDYPGIVEYGHDEQVWLKTLLPLPHGIPSVSTFRRVFAALQPAVLAKVMQGWSGELSGSLAGKHLALDGKPCGAVLNMPGTRVACIWSPPGAWTINWCWPSRPWTRRATRSPPYPKCWSCWT